MSETAGKEMLSIKKPIIIAAPVPNAEEHTLSPEIWDALMEEINRVTARISAGEELVPEDVERVRALKKQVDNYLTVFNKALRNAQDTYKKLVENQLKDLGYPVIEQYILTQRKKQADAQNAKIAEKQRTLRDIVEKEVAGTRFLKGTAIAGGILPAFTHRFPKVNSAAKDKEIRDWGPYEAIVSSTVLVLDVFFSDKAYEGAALLPITSATMQCLLSYVRDGDTNRLLTMRDTFAKDAGILQAQRLRQKITDKDIALACIKDIMEQELPANEKIKGIADIIRIAETL